MGIIKTSKLVHEFIRRDEEGNVESITTALDNVNLDIKEGQFIAILGHNGSGKSTLAKHINALLAPSDGTIWVDGMDVSKEENVIPVRKSAGMVFQNPDNQIIANVVEEDVGFGPENIGVPTDEIWQRVDYALRAVGMTKYRTHSPNKLSGGQKQRVAIAGVVAMEPKCIVDTLNNMAVVTSGTDANGNTNYRGVLYDWNTDTTGNTQYEWSADSTSYYREPANLSSSTEGDEANSSKIEGWSSTLYQEEYNKMVKSVSEYGGFYIGRYEMSINATSKNAESKYGATSATAESANQWYGLYNKAKTYAPEKNSDNTENASQKVVSSMIWGSQYDAMLKWMKGNKINVTSSSPTDLSIGTTSKNTTRVTGGANNGQTVSKDKLSNIYDLLGNSREWTQEANNTNYRVYRGGLYNRSSAPSSRGSYLPPNTGSFNGSRLTL